MTEAVMPVAFPTDFMETGTATPPTRPPSSRRETILSLVEMLLQESDDGGRGKSLALPLCIRTDRMQAITNKYPPRTMETFVSGATPPSTRFLC